MIAGLIKESRKNTLLIVAAGVCLLFSFEETSRELISRITHFLGLRADVGFWSMGISASAWYALSVISASLLISSGIFSRNGFRGYLVPSITFLTFFLVQLYRRPFALPFWDDYYGYYEWQLHLSDLQGISSKAGAFFESYLECKTFISRVIAEFIRLISGPEFIHVTKLLNMVLLVMIAWFFAEEHRDPKRREFVFLITGLLLFNLQQFYNLLCAFSGTTYYTVVLAAMLAFRHRNSGKPGRMILSVTWGVIAAYTFGNGWIVLPMIVLFRLLDRDYRSAYFAAAVLLIAAWWYFHDYRPERLNPVERFEGWQFALYALSFLGGHLQFHDFYMLPFVQGAIVVTVFVYGFMIHRWEFRKQAGLQMAAFLIATSFVAAYFRHQNGFQQSLSLRYGFFSVTALAAALSYLVYRQSDAAFLRYRNLLLGGAVLLTGLKSLFFYPEMAIAQTENHRMIRNWLLAGTTIEKRTAFYPEKTTEILEKSEKAQIWERKPFDTTAVNNSVFTIAYISPSSLQKDP
ncbi:MAG: hypothetical protein RL213_2089 [Bacteroidota bacterium]|jgi:hypothetical protein